MKITTKKSYTWPSKNIQREFYKNGDRIAFYVIQWSDRWGDYEAEIYSPFLARLHPDIDFISISKPDFKSRNILKELKKIFPEELAEAMFKYLKKDFGL
jgi:hypothetical protein